MRLMKMSGSIRGSAVTKFACFTIGSTISGATSSITTFRGLDLSDLDIGMAFDNSAVTDWSGIYLAAVTNPVGNIFGLDIAIPGNRLGGLLIGTGFPQG